MQCLLKGYKSTLSDILGPEEVIVQSRENAKKPACVVAVIYSIWWLDWFSMMMGRRGVIIGEREYFPQNSLEKSRHYDSNHHYMCLFIY